MMLRNGVIFLVLTTLLPAAPLGPRQPVGEILNPSIETLDANNRPSPWALDPAPRGNAAPGGQVSSDVAHAGTRSLLLSAAGTSWTNKTLALSVVNPTWETQRLGFKLVGAQPVSGQGKAWVLAGPDDMAYNDPGKDPGVKFGERIVSGFADTLEVTPVSATIFHIRVK